MITVITFSILFAGVLIIDQILYRLNKHILELRMNDIMLRIDEAHDILKDAGLANVQAYRDSARKELISKFIGYKFGKTGFIYIINEKGQALTGGNTSIIPYDNLKKISTEKSGFTEFKSLSNGKSKFSFFDTSKFQWKIFLIMDKKELYEQRNLYILAVSLIGILVLISGLGVSYLLAARFSRQTIEILNCVKNVAKNDLSSKINIQPITDEYGELQLGINSMIDELREREIEREKALEEFGKHQKFESLGILAGGIAHDFNNLLTAIRGNVQLAQMYKHDSEELKHCLSDTEHATVRAMDLTRQLLTFAKGGTPVKTTASIPELLQSTVTFILRGSKSKCEFAFAEKLRPVDIDTTQISQVIDNLVINANQSMPNGGIINIRAENAYINETSTLPLEKGEYIKITITDHGTGILKQNIPKIFDPFFTTKHSGTGLGLATSYAILKRHGGHISVESEVGIGSTFYVYLPASINAVKVKALLDSMSYAGGGRILVMDDQESIRALLGKMLALMNYEAEFANDGQKAVDIFAEAKKSGKPFDAVIMDLTVPGAMGGKEAVKVLREIDPDVIAFVTSGYSNDPVMAQYKEYGFKGRLDKPFKIQDLKNLLKSFLNNKTNES